MHLLSTESLDCVSTGCEMSRVEKTELVATYEPSYRFLNVCVNPAFEGRNCSVCFKCCRTMITMEFLGSDHLYRKVFDFEKFGKVRRQYLKKILFHKPGSFEREIAGLILEKGNGVWPALLSMRQRWESLLGR